MAAISSRVTYWAVAHNQVHFRKKPVPFLELSKGGKQPVTLSNGETRTFLNDGDAVIMRGWCEKKGAARIGFGEVSALVLPAKIEG